MRVAILLSLISSSYGSTQSVGVTGKVFCKNKPLGRTALQLFDRWLILSDKLMTTGLSDESGSFMIRGTTSGFFSIRPELRIYHRCNYNGVRTCSNLE
ncbi:hypothetical protein Y032_0887g2871 [Ancylostoma ceylanicum]|uniref:Transthyretin-like family protein n=1 Tax=Ancylostoma ceylanicum TaxID=53326 RepID=A0A016WAA8_9BILA|nr:hypothetical protein Y032_0887g2871 [Ancylostoma ceylanicum]